MTALRDKLRHHRNTKQRTALNSSQPKQSRQKNTRGRIFLNSILQLGTEVQEAAAGCPNPMVTLHPHGCVSGMRLLSLETQRWRQVSIKMMWPMSKSSEKDFTLQFSTDFKYLPHKHFWFLTLLLVKALTEIFQLPSGNRDGLHQKRAVNPSLLCHKNRDRGNPTLPTVTQQHRCS